MSDSDNNPYSKRPADTKFKQQRLPAWKPVLTPRSVLPWILFFGVLFLAVGIGLLIGSNKVKEQTVEYTDCRNTQPMNNGTSCGDLLNDFANGYTNISLDNRCVCDVEITLSEGFNSAGSVFIYYALDNFYQNHRAYVSSRWDAQLRSITTRPGSDCAPLDFDENDLPYAPCGLIANSLFNDTIELLQCDDPGCNSQTRMEVSGRDIAWASDRRTKFRNPPHMPGQLCDAPAFNNSAKPVNWPVPICELGSNSTTYHAHDPMYGSSGLGYENEDLIVWMRTAALPSFRKLYRHVVDPAQLSNGKYLLRIGYNYPVKEFGGKKTVVISTTSFQGGKNPFLGVCYIVVGVLCIISVLIFFVLMRFKGRELGSDAHLNW